MIRKTLFWAHFVAGLAAGVVIAVMCVTGVALAFEKEIIAWAERGARALPAEARGSGEPLSIPELVERVREARPGFEPATATVFAAPDSAVLLAQGRSDAVYVNPWSGEIHAEGARRTRRFMDVMFQWHRWLSRSGESRDRGKAITGASNVAFLALAISGIVLWWPRRWTRTALRAITWFKSGLKGKARDWNWHNVIGAWSAPVLIVLTATAIPISYKWAGDWLNGIGAPAQAAPGAGGGAQGRGPGTGPAAASESRPAGAAAKQPGVGAIIASVQREFPRWDQIVFRLGGGGAGGGGRGPGGPGASAQSRGPGSLVVSVREADRWPRFATRQATLDSETGAVIRSQSSYAGQPTGRRIRMWTRFLHTGEALGPAGQFVAGVASLGGAVLVWTGFALAFRRMFGRRRGTAKTEASSDVESQPFAETVVSKP